MRFKKISLLSKTSVKQSKNISKYIQELSKIINKVEIMSPKVQ